MAAASGASGDALSKTLAQLDAVPILYGVLVGQRAARASTNWEKKGGKGKTRIGRRNDKLDLTTRTGAAGAADAFGHAWDLVREYGHVTIIDPGMIGADPRASDTTALFLYETDANWFATALSTAYPDEKDKVRPLFERARDAVARMHDDGALGLTDVVAFVVVMAQLNGTMIHDKKGAIVSDNLKRLYGEFEAPFKQALRLLRNHASLLQSFLKPAGATRTAADIYAKGLVDLMRTAGETATARDPTVFLKAQPDVVQFLHTLDKELRTQRGGKASAIDTQPAFFNAMLLQPDWSGRVMNARAREVYDPVVHTASGASKTSSSSAAAAADSDDSDEEGAFAL